MRTALNDDLPRYQVYAIRYATRAGTRAANFLGGDPHDGPMDMDYYVWLIRGNDQTFVVDTGFAQDVGKRRGRTQFRTAAEGLAVLGVDAVSVKEVILTHLHYDHAGTFDAFPAARFHLQDEEMEYATGRHMKTKRFSHGYEVDEVCGMVRLVYGDRVLFHRGSATLAPGVSVHHVGGHSKGLQCVRVSTKRGWVVLASDASHYYEHFTDERVFPTVYHVGQAVDGYRTLLELADSSDHIIPGHDPLVMSKYAAPSADMEGIIAALHLPPM